MSTNREDDRLRRWRLLLGGDGADGTGIRLDGTDAQLDACLAALYDPSPGGGKGAPPRRGGLGGSQPNVARWLGDIRT